MSPEKELSDLIAKRLLHVNPADQGLQLGDSDWLLIINALGHFAMQEYGEDEEPSFKFGRALSDLPKLAVAAGCHVGIKVTNQNFSQNIVNAADEIEWQKGRVKALEETLNMLRNTVGDLRNGFSKSVDPARWVDQFQAEVDRVIAKAKF